MLGDWRKAFAANYEIPLSEADQIALRPALLHDLGATPFESGALISRSLWVIFIGESSSAGRPHLGGSMRWGRTEYGR